MLTHMAHIIFTDARKKLNGVAICTAECRFAWIRNIWTRCGVRWSSRACLPHSFTVAEQGPLYGRVQASILCTMFFIGLVHHHHHHYHYHKGKVATYRYGITVELHVFVALVAAAGVVPLRFHSICCHRLECANGSGKTKGCSKRTNHLIAEKNTLVFFHTHRHALRPDRTSPHHWANTGAVFHRMASVLESKIRLQFLPNSAAAFGAAAITIHGRWWWQNQSCYVAYQFRPTDAARTSEREKQWSTVRHPRCIEWMFRGVSSFSAIWRQKLWRFAAGVKNVWRNVCEIA